MKLLDTFRCTAVSDCYLFVTDRINPATGQHAVLITDRTGERVAAWVEGSYDQEQNNHHLGIAVRGEEIGALLVAQVITTLDRFDGGDEEEGATTSAASMMNGNPGSRRTEGAGGGDA